MKELPAKYDHKEAEKKWQASWEKDEVYAWNESVARDESFVIDTPPPTVSGVLHMGHIFSYTQADFVARYMRMSGKNVFYPMGFDDNGLPTERLVEKVKKVRATDMSREEFIELCEGVAEEARKEFRRLFETTALSVDWKQEYHTISEDSRKISQMSFLDLFEKENAYRKLQPMLWDPIDQTAIAQAEVEDKEMESHANYIPFGLIDESDAKDPSKINWDEIEKVEIMTTRPELLPACVALMHHPDDAEKYKGKKAVTPLFNVVVDIVASDKVDMEKGTGVVMCCTFGDETDIEWWREHKLPLRQSLNKYGKISITTAPLETGKEPCTISFGIEAKTGTVKEFVDIAGLDSSASSSTIDERNCIDVKKAAKLIDELQNKKVKAAREEIIEILKSEKLLKKQEEISHAVKCAERSGAALEILPTNQWFIKILDKKEELHKKVNECVWHPEYMKLRAEQWIDGLNWDWCISRQRYFGVPFPIWYSKRAGEEGKIIVASKDSLPVNPLVDLPEGYKKDEVEPELDVMDTWATSSVSPQLSSKAITKDYAIDYERHQKLFPADLRPQAHEIIRTWAFYTIVKAHLHEDSIPWKNLMISGWCLASDKTKMSKSKGNVVTPVDLIEEQGADVVRYWSSTSKLGTDTAFSEDVLKIGKKLVNKVWNASKFAAIHFDKLKEKPKSAKEDIESGIISETLDKWIITRLLRAIEKATKDFERFEYSNARSAVEDFFWNDFCDNYLEMVKGRSYNEDGSDSAGQQSAIHTIYHCLEGILKLFAPIIPHVTDELYSHIFDDLHDKSIHSRGSWPKVENYLADEAAEKSGIATKEILDVVRKLKAEKNISIKWPIEELFISGEDKSLVESCFDDLAKVTNSEKITWRDEEAKDSLATEDEAFKIAARFASKSDAA